MNKPNERMKAALKFLGKNAWAGARDVGIYLNLTSTSNGQYYINRLLAMGYLGKNTDGSWKVLRAIPN